MTELFDKIAPVNWDAEKLRALGQAGIPLAALLDCIQRAGDLKDPEIMHEVVRQVVYMAVDVLEVNVNGDTNAVS